MVSTPRLVRMHARLLLRCAERRASAERLRDREPERADIAADEAAEALADANALRDLLATLPEVAIPDERQLSLISDGGIQ